MGGFAWVTLATNNSYSLGALVLAHSLKRANTAHKLAVLITPAVSQPMRDQLQTVFDLVKVVDVLDSKDEAHLALLKRPDLGITFTKIHCWRLTEFEKCVFLDADTLVVRNCDELFEKEEFSAAPDVSWPDCFNSGVFVYRPSVETFNKILQFAVENRSFDGGDQGLLNQYFSDWATEDIKKHLPFVYNLTTVAAYSYIPAFKHYGSETRIVHFIGTGKPWLQQLDVKTRTVTPTSGSEHLAPILQQWWDLFCEKVQPNLDKNLESNNDGMSHPPVEANSLPIALIDEPETARLVEPPVAYREKDDFRQYNLPYQPFEVKGPSGESLNVEFLAARVVTPEETVEKLPEESSGGQLKQDHMEEKQDVIDNGKGDDEIGGEESKDFPQQENHEVRKSEKTDEASAEDKNQQEEQQQEEPPPPEDPFEYNTFFPDETCISNYLEKNVVTYQPFENHQENIGEENIPSLPRFLTIPQNDQRQSGNIETQQQKEHPQPQTDHPVAHPQREPTPPRVEREGSPPKEEIQVKPPVEKQELTKSKSMSSFPCHVTTPPRLSIWKSQPDVNIDPNRKYSMPKLKPILPKQRSFSKSVPSAIPKVTMYTEVLMSSDYEDPYNLPKDKIGFVETHIRREAKLRRSKSDADVRDKFGPLPYGLSPEVEIPVVTKRVPLRPLDNDFYDLAKCKRQMGNKPKPKNPETKRPSICSLPPLKPIVPAKNKKSTLIKKRKSKELSPGDGGKEKMAKREPKIVRDRKRGSINTPRNVSTNGNNLDEILERLRGFSKNYQHFFGVERKPTDEKNAAGKDGGESNSVLVGNESTESQISKKSIESLEFRQFRNYVKDRRETSQKGLLNIQDILSESKEDTKRNSLEESENEQHSTTENGGDPPSSAGQSTSQSFSIAVEDGDGIKRPPLKRQSKVSDCSDDFSTPTESSSNRGNEFSSYSADENSVVSAQQLEKNGNTVECQKRKNKEKLQTNFMEREKKSVAPLKNSRESETSPEPSCSSHLTTAEAAGSSSAAEAVHESKKVEETSEVLNVAEFNVKHLENAVGKVNSKAGKPVVEYNQLDCSIPTTEEGKDCERSAKQSEDSEKSVGGVDDRQPAETAKSVECKKQENSSTPLENSNPAEKEKVDSKYEKSNVIIVSEQEKNVEDSDRAAETTAEKQEENRKAKTKREVVDDDVINVRRERSAAVTSSPADVQKMHNGLKTPVEDVRRKTAVEKTKKREDDGRQETGKEKNWKNGKILDEMDTPRTTRVTPPNAPQLSNGKAAAGKGRTTAWATSPQVTPPENGFSAPRKTHASDDRKAASGIAGAIAQLNLEEVSGKIPESSAMSAAHQEYLRRQNWETGNVDYMGRDSFDNIWSKICQTIEAKESEEKAVESAKKELEESQTTTKPEEKTVPPSNVTQKCPEYVETLPDEPAAVGPNEDDEIIFSKPEDKQKNLTNIAEEEEVRAEGSAVIKSGKVKLSDILQPGVSAVAPAASPAVVKPIEILEKSKLQPAETPTDVKLQPMDGSSDIKSPPTAIPAGLKSQTTTSETKPSPTASSAGSKPQSSAPTLETKTQPTAAPTETKPQPTAAPTETKPSTTEKPECKVTDKLKMAVTSQLPLQLGDQKTEHAKSQQEKRAGECRTVAIPSPPITFPGAPLTEKDILQSKKKKPEEKPQVVSDPIPLPPPDTPPADPSQSTEMKTSESDSVKDEGKQKKGVFTKLLEMVGVAPKEKNGGDTSKSVFYDAQPGEETKQGAEEGKKAGESEVKQSQPVEKGEEAKEKPSKPEEKETEIVKTAEVETTNAEKQKTPAGETKPGQPPFPKPARSSSPREQKQPTDSIQPSTVKKSPSPKLKITQNRPETEVTTPTPPPMPDVPTRKNSGLLKVDETILETPPVPEPPKESREETAKGKVSAEVENIIGKAKSEVESLLQDRRSAEKNTEESSDLINTMKLMMGDEQPEKSPTDMVEELKVTSEEERKRHKGEAVTSKLSDQILKAIPPPRRKAISEAAASTSAIPKETEGQEQKTPPGEGKLKSSKPSAIPVPPPRNRGKPTPPAPSKGKGKK